MAPRGLFPEFLNCRPKKSTLFRWIFLGEGTISRERRRENMKTKLGDFSIEEGYIIFLR
jgi:hypothetical protein